MTISKQLQELLEAVRYTVKMDLSIRDLRKALEAYEDSLKRQEPTGLANNFIQMVVDSENAPAFCSPPWGRAGARTFKDLFGERLWLGSDSQFTERLRELAGAFSMRHTHTELVVAWDSFRKMGVPK